MYIQLDIIFSFLLIVILILRWKYGPVVLPFYRFRVLRIVYILIFGVILLLSFARLGNCISRFWFNWIADKYDMQNVVLIYYFWESIAWSLQLTMNITLVSNFIYEWKKERRELNSPNKERWKSERGGKEHDISRDVELG
jgi:hypothetical protein